MSNEHQNSDESADTVVPLMVLPEGGFKPFVKAEDLADIDKRDQRVLLAMSVLEQKIDFSLEWAMRTNRYQRRIAAEMSKQNLDQADDRWRWRIVTWIGTSLGAGIIAALINWIFR